MFVGALEERVDDAETGNGMKPGDARNQRQLETQGRLGRQFPEMAVGKARPNQRRRSRVGNYDACQIGCGEREERIYRAI